MSEHEQRMAFAQALRNARDETGIKQEELAKTVGVVQGTISAYERGGVEPPPQQVFAIEAALNLPGGFLSRHLGYIPAPTESTDQTDDRLAMQTAAELRALELVARKFREAVDSFEKLRHK